jgi:hypothetical protein
MHIILTICSANYLAHAKTLGDSILEHNPDVHFVIGLVDVMSPEVDMTGFEQFEVLDVEKTLPEGVFRDLLSKYYLIELNTAVKPYLMDYLYKRDPSVETVSYFDPDIKVYSSLAPLFQNVKEKGIIVTPHGCTYDDSPENIKGEKSMLAVGIYNLGFIATSRSAETSEFLRWWMLRLKDHCTYRADIPGTFFDQNWVMLAGLYFDHFFVEKNPGFNLAHWNLFERKVSMRDGKYFINERHPLIFLHYSGYKPENPDMILARSNNPMDFSGHVDLKPLFDDYRKSLSENDYKRFKAIKWHYQKNKEKSGSAAEALSIVKKMILFFFKIIPLGTRKRFIGIVQQSMK